MSIGGNLEARSFNKLKDASVGVHVLPSMGIKHTELELEIDGLGLEWAMVQKSTFNQTGANSTSPASPESHTLTKLKPDSVLTNDERNWKHILVKKCLPYIDKLLQSAFFAIQQTHHIDVLLVESNPSDPVIWEQRFGCLITTLVSRDKKRIQSQNAPV